MKFSCEQCQTKYNLPDERVRGKVLKIRCKKCGCQITVSQGGVRTARNEGDGEDATMIGSRASVAAMTGGKVPAGGGGGHDDSGDGGDSTMIGGMNNFFANLAGAGGAGGQPQGPDEWHLSIDGNVVDPMPLADLAQRIVSEQGIPGRDMYVWREGQPEWLPPESLPEVLAAVEKARRNPAPPKAAAKPAPAASAGLGDDDEDEGGDKTQMGSLDFAALGLEAKAPWEEAAAKAAPAKSEPAKADAKTDGKAAKDIGKTDAKTDGKADTKAGSKDTAKESAKSEPAKSAAKDAIKSAAKDAASKVDSVKSAAKDAVDSVKSAAKDGAKDGAKADAKADPFKPAAKDTAKEAAKPAVKETPAAKAAPKPDADELLEDEPLESVDAIEEDIAMPAPPPKGSKPPPPKPPAMKAPPSLPKPPAPAPAVAAPAPVAPPVSAPAPGAAPMLSEPPFPVAPPVAPPVEMPPAAMPQMAPAAPAPGGWPAEPAAMPAPTSTDGGYTGPSLGSMGGQQNQGDGGGNPYGGNPYGGNPYGGDPYGGNPYGGSPAGSAADPMAQGGGMPDAASAPAPTSKSKVPLFAAAAALVALLGGGAYFLLVKPPAGPPTPVVDAGSDAGTVKPKEEPKPVPKPEPPKITGITKAEFDELWSAGSGPVTSCFEKALKKQADLEGKELTVSVSVSDKGKMGEVSFAGAELDDKAKKCIQKAMKKWKFPAKDKAAYTAKFPLKIAK